MDTRSGEKRTKRKNLNNEDEQTDVVKSSDSNETNLDTDNASGYSQQNETNLAKENRSSKGLDCSKSAMQHNNGAKGDMQNNTGAKGDKTHSREYSNNFNTKQAKPNGTEKRGKEDMAKQDAQIENRSTTDGASESLDSKDKRENEESNKKQKEREGLPKESSKVDQVETAKEKIKEGVENNTMKEEGDKDGKIRDKLPKEKSCTRDISTQTIEERDEKAKEERGEETKQEIDEKGEQVKGDERKKSANDGRNGLIIVFFFAFSLGLVVGFSLCKITQPFQDQDETKPLEEAKSGPNLLADKLKELESNFPRQHKKLWRVIRATLQEPLFEDYPAKPGIILLATDSDGLETSKCLAESILTVVDNIMEAKHLKIDLTNLSEISLAHYQRKTEEETEELHKTLLDGFRGGAKAVFMTGIQHLSGAVAMVLKSYTDNENALYKKAVIITSLENLDGTESLEAHSWDQKVMDVLSALWENDIGRSKAFALASRVANNIVFVKAEDREALHKSKCFLGI